MYHGSSFISDGSKLNQKNQLIVNQMNKNNINITNSDQINTNIRSNTSNLEVKFMEIFFLK